MKPELFSYFPGQFFTKTALITRLKLDFFPIRKLRKVTHNFGKDVQIDLLKIKVEFKYLDPDSGPLMYVDPDPQPCSEVTRGAREINMLLISMLNIQPKTIVSFFTQKKWL